MAPTGRQQLVDLLHLGALVVLERREVIIVLVLRDLVVLVNGEPELDHAVDAAREGGGLVERETGGEQGGVEEEPDEVLDGLVVLVLLGAGTEGVDDWVHRVDLHGLLGGHVTGHGAVLEGLGLHDTLHVGGPAVLTGHETARGARETVGHDHLLGLVAEDLLHELAESLTGSLLLLELLLLVLGLLEVEALLGHCDELLAVVLLELLHTVLVDRVDHEDHLVATLLELLDERGRLDSLLRLTGDVVDVLLLLLHASHVVLERGHLVTGLGGVVPQELGELGAVLAVLVDTELEVLAELLVELGEVLLVLGDLVEHLERLLDEVLLDHLKDLRALEHLAGNVKREVLGVDEALEEAQELGDEVLAGVGDEDTAHVELDVALLLGRLELVERGALRDEDHGLELKLALNREVLGVHSHGVRDEESRVETDTELADHRHIGTGLDSLHEGLGARLGDGSEVVHQVGLGHADARVGESKGVVALVTRDVDEEILLGLEELRVGETLVADLVEGVARVGDELAEEDLLV